MKKIALLFTILCAGQLYGMEQPNELDPTLWGKSSNEGGLPDEVKTIILIAYAQSGDNVEGAISNIKKASLINTQLNQMINETYGNVEGFTKLVHILADKFNTTTQTVAEKFNTPTAKKYLKLGDELLTLAGSSRKKWEIIKLIKEGADVNFTGNYFNDRSEFWATGSPLGLAIENLNVPEVKTLLELGAKLTDADLMNAERLSKLSLERIKRRRQGLRGDEADDIYSLLLEAQINLLEEQLPLKAKARKK